MRVPWTTSRSNQSILKEMSPEYSRLISIRINWLDRLAVQGTLKSLFQHHNLKATVLQRSAFFMVQLSHLYMTTGKTIALTIWNFVGKVMSLLFNVLFRFTLLTAIFSYAENGWCIVGSK